MLTSFELRGRADNLLKEQNIREEKQRRQAEKDRLLKQRQAERDAQREEEARQRRLEEAERAAQVTPHPHDVMHMHRSCLT